MIDHSGISVSEAVCRTTPGTWNSGPFKNAKSRRSSPERRLRNSSAGGSSVWTVLSTLKTDEPV